MDSSPIVTVELFKLSRLAFVFWSFSLHLFPCVLMCVSTVSASGKRSVKMIWRSVCFYPMRLSSALIIGVFLFHLLSVAKDQGEERRRWGENPAPFLLTLPKIPGTGVQKQFLSRNLGSLNSWPGGRSRSKAGGCRNNVNII